MRSTSHAAPHYAVAMTDAQISSIEQALAGQWLEEERAARGVSSSLPPAPTPFAGGFEPPVSAPPPPTPTLAPVPVGTPVG